MAIINKIIAKKQKALEMSRASDLISIFFPEPMEGRKKVASVSATAIMQIGATVCTLHSTILWETKAKYMRQNVHNKD